MKTTDIATNQAPAFTFRQDCDRDGALVYSGAKTIERYMELAREEPATDGLPAFFAYSNAQFKEGAEALRREYGEDAVIKRWGAGLFGTEEGIRDFFRLYDERDRRIAEECDPQEVYCYEFNNHESFLDWDGDTNAIRKVIGIFGVEAARRVRRFCEAYTIDELVKK